MEYDQDKLKRVCYTGVTIVGGLIYSAFYFLNIYRGQFFIMLDIELIYLQHKRN